MIPSEMTAPGAAHLPLKLMHDFGYDADAPYEVKRAAVETKLRALRDKGFGGVVTNVRFQDNYLQNEEEWRLLRDTFRICRELGLRTWIYDENGYPSGGAGVLTLAGHPEWQAQGLAMACRIVKPGERAHIAFPHGHTCVYAAYAYRADSLETLTDEAALRPAKTFSLAPQGDLDDVNDTPDTLLYALFARKNSYEGTHAAHNVFESRRYIDVSCREAVAAFIDNTYRPYAERLRDVGPIEAFFTDEPSYMGAYINFGLKPPVTRDAPDEDMPLLPSVNWGADVDNEFHARKGYALGGKTVLLFAGHGALARRTRVDFYETLSELYEARFFGQIADYCAQNSAPFSGHVLLEDDIRYHPVFEGNYFSMLRHMHFPGIDMLYGIPEMIRSFAFTPKLVSSVAHAYGRRHVMSEISAHAQGGKVTDAQFLGTMYTQYALGVDLFTSYFSETQVEDAFYRACNESVGRIDRVMGGGRHVCDVAVYYPIETVQAGTLPYGQEIYAELDRNRENTACWLSLKNAQDTLLARQIDFDYVDAELIRRADAGEGGFTLRGGETFRALVVPACYVDDALSEQLKRLDDAGARIYLLADPLFLIPDAWRGRVVSGPDALADALSDSLPPAVSLCGAPGVLALCRENECGRSILLVNTENRCVETAARVRTMGARVRVYDPMANEIIGAYDAGECPILLAPYAAIMILSAE